MGLRKTYYKAKEYLNSPPKIAAAILAFLRKHIEVACESKPDRICVTLPASFQLNQRRDTLLACEYAGLKLEDSDLLEEPTAALIDYFLSNDIYDIIDNRDKIRCVVFDFGGGTCDVSVVEIYNENGKFAISELAVSRYHRLGGGDIDAAIVHKKLIPDLLKENNLSPFDLSWAEKKKGLEPQLLSTAEALKISLSNQIDRLIKFGKYDNIDKASIKAEQMPVICNLGKRSFKLSKPQLTAADFEAILAPFLDEEFLFIKETDYTLSQSIFAPITDALEKADLKREDINFCLFVGGSSLIPHIKKALANFFRYAKIGTYSNAFDIQTAVSKGAAINALIKHITGKPLIEPVLHDGISILTNENKKITLIPPKTPLPYPPDGTFDSIKLYVPETDYDDCIYELKVDIVSQKTDRIILSEIWELPEGSCGGDEIILKYRITSGKQFICEAYLTDYPDDPLELSVENPLTHVSNPNELLLKIEEAEEKLRNRGGGDKEDVPLFVNIAIWYAELHQYERAINHLKTALKKLNRADSTILNLIGAYYANLGDRKRAEKAYREAIDTGENIKAPAFNLALLLHSDGENREAVNVLDRIIARGYKTGPVLTLKALCMNDPEDNRERVAIMQEAADYFIRNLTFLGEWELGWAKTLASIKNDLNLKSRIEEEEVKRKTSVDMFEDSILRPSTLKIDE